MLSFEETATIERIKNAATNGRLFNIMVFAAALYTSHPVIALLPILAVGTGYLSDALAVVQNESLRFALGKSLSVACIIVSVLGFISLIAYN